MKQTLGINTISGRLLILGVLPAMLAIATIVVLSAIGQRRNLGDAERRVLAACAVGAVEELQVRLNMWNSIAESMALAQEQGLHKENAGSEAYARDLLKALHPGAAGVFVVHKAPATAEADDRRASPQVSIGLRAVHGAALDIRPFEIGDPETMDAYRAAKAAFRPFGASRAILTEPELVQGEYVVTHACAFAINGQFGGVAGVERELSRLSSIAHDIQHRSDADVFLISRKGRIITAAMNDATKKDVEAALSMRMLGETPFASLSGRWMLDRSKGSPEVFIEQDPELNQACVYAAFSTAEGAWQVVLRRPQSEVMKKADQSIMTHAIVGAILIILGAGTMFLVSRGVAGRVRSAAAAADRIARGDLTREVTESGAADETGGLVRSMRSMDSNLSSLIGDVKLAAVRLNSTATEIAATSRQQEATTGTFGAASSQVAAAVKEISATSRDLVRTMEKVNRNAQESAELAGTGRDGLQGMESVMTELTSGSRSIAEKLGAISDRSEKITAVVTMIAKVADQTNILSINAAIEAEKAGEVGAGFLVIAREIRRLADQTAGATLEIEQMVRQMQGAVGAGVKEMERFADQVRRGGKEVTGAGTVLTGIINRVNSSTQEIRGVNEAIQAQSEGAQQISDAMSSLAGGAGQTAQAAREFGRAAADLQEAIATLRDAVSKFKLRD